TEEEVYNAVVRTAAKDYALNHFLVNANIQRLFFGDPAEFTKFNGSNVKSGSIVPGKVSEVIDATLKENSKRLAKDIAPGQLLDWNTVRYKALVMKDVKS